MTGASSWFVHRRWYSRPANDNVRYFVPGLATVLILVALSLIGRLLVAAP